MPFVVPSEPSVAASDDALRRRLADPVYSRAFVDWIEASVRRATGRARLAKGWPSSTSSQSVPGRPVTPADAD